MNEVMIYRLLAALAVVLTAHCETFASDVLVHLRYVEFEVANGDTPNLNPSLAKQAFKKVASLQTRAELGKHYSAEVKTATHTLKAAGALRPATGEPSHIECEINALYQLRQMPLGEYRVTTKIRLRKGEDVLLAGSLDGTTFCAFVLSVHERKK